MERLPGLAGHVGVVLAQSVEEATEGSAHIGLEQGGSRGFATLRLGLVYNVPLE